MDNTKRRNKIIELLESTDEVYSASSLAKTLGVSRQIIVGDVALLRAEGHDIISTPRGYLYNSDPSGRNYCSRQIVCIHGAKEMQQELYTIVDTGCTVGDVIVEHPIYGQLVGKLELSSRFDVDEFVRKSREENVVPLSALTEGIHIHTIYADNEKKLNQAVEKLRAMGILFER